MKTKYLILILLLTCGIGRAQTSTLVRVEPLTDAQVKSLSNATNAVDAAQKNLTKVEAQIAAEHKMKVETWMEWRSWYEFDGKFILFRYQCGECFSDNDRLVQP